MLKKVISIHQPYYIPWINYFSKIEHSDIFVLLDSVQYQKNSFYNRNYIKNKDDKLLLTVPVSHSSFTDIREVLITDSFWQKKHFKSITYSYHRAPNFALYIDFLEDIYLNQKWDSLSSLNIHIISEVINFLSIETEIVKSSNLNIATKGSDLVLDICKLFNADVYLSGKSGSSYLNFKDFNETNIKLRNQVYLSKSYSQLGSSFLPNLSIIDFLMNCDTDSFKDYVGN